MKDRDENIIDFVLKYIIIPWGVVTTIIVIIFLTIVAIKALTS